MTKRENSTVAVHLLEVTLLCNFRLLNVSLVLKHMGLQLFFLLLSLSTGRWNLTINLDDCSRWIDHPVADTERAKTLNACPVNQHT